MSLYLRYFDRETLVPNVDEAIGFLNSIDEIGMTPMLEHDVRAYAESDMPYPKRYKVRPRVYFIVIKTDAETMQDFKEKKAVRKPVVEDAGEEQVQRPLTPSLGRLSIERFGWYEGTVLFKRVLLVPSTGKFQYRDTTFTAACKASSGLECYERIIEHLRSRVDSRSQFPSVKGKNYRFRFLGGCKQV